MNVSYIFCRPSSFTASDVSIQKGTVLNLSVAISTVLCFFERTNLKESCRGCEVNTPVTDFLLTRISCIRIWEGYSGPILLEKSKSDTSGMSNVGLLFTPHSSNSRAQNSLSLGLLMRDGLLSRGWMDCSL